MPAYFSSWLFCSHTVIQTAVLFTNTMTANIGNNYGEQSRILPRAVFYVLGIHAIHKPDIINIINIFYIYYSEHNLFYNHLNFQDKSYSYAYFIMKYSALLWAFENYRNWKVKYGKPGYCTG